MDKGVLGPANKISKTSKLASSLTMAYEMDEDGVKTTILESFNQRMYKKSYSNQHNNRTVPQLTHMNNTSLTVAAF